VRAVLAWSTALMTCLMLHGCDGGGAAGRGKERARPTEVGACFAGVDGARPVECSEPHVAETVFVGRRVPPEPGAALKPCRSAARGYLGQEANTRLELRLWIASDKSWYRCDVFLRKSTRARAGYETLTGSLKGVLREGVSPRLQSCLDEPFDPRRDQPYTPCTDEHVAQEIFMAPVVGVEAEPYPADIAQRATNSCNAMAVAEGLLVGRRTVVAFYPEDEAAWASGQRTAVCWVQAPKGETLPPLQPVDGG
jgi:hypothetical protein